MHQTCVNKRKGQPGGESASESSADWCAEINQPPRISQPSRRSVRRESVADRSVAGSCTELHVCNAPNCSNNASGQCRKCKKVYYCCRQHQCEDWKAHKEVCFNAPLSTNELRTHVFNAPDCFNRASGQCKRCKKVYYCSGEHLKQDWKAHKKVCMPDDVEAEWID